MSNFISKLFGGKSFDYDADTKKLSEEFHDNIKSYSQFNKKLDLLLNKICYTKQHANMLISIAKKIKQKLK